MKKITPQKLSKRLTQYGALTLALAGIAGANAQEEIIYTDIPDYSGPNYWIDFDGDATNDIVIFSASSGLFVNAFGSNNILGSAYSHYNSTQGWDETLVYPFALDSGAIISAGQNSWFNQNNYAHAYSSLNWNSCSGGNWCNDDKYLGVQFKIGADTHYGWARLDVGTSGTDWTLKSYAYHKSPDALILAGQTTSLGIGDNTLSKVKIVALHKSIGLYNLQNATKYRLFNITGKEVLKGTTNNRDYVIEAPTLASGIYIVELGDTKSSAIFRKKVVLQ